MKVAALTGPSGSGKTTVIEALIRRYRAAGHTVGVIKHTHHPLTTEDRGDTRRFRAAGADQSVLAGDGEAIRFPELTRVSFTDPMELLALFATDIVLVEGFKSFHGWARVEVTPDVTANDAAQLLDRIWRS